MVAYVVEHAKTALAITIRDGMQLSPRLRNLCSSYSTTIAHPITRSPLLLPGPYHAMTASAPHNLQSS